MTQKQKVAVGLLVIFGGSLLWIWAAWLLDMPALAIIALACILMGGVTVSDAFFGGK